MPGNATKEQLTLPGWQRESKVQVLLLICASNVIVLGCTQMFPW